MKGTQQPVGWRQATKSRAVPILVALAMVLAVAACSDGEVSPRVGDLAFDSELCALRYTGTGALEGWAYDTRGGKSYCYRHVTDMVYDAYDRISLTLVRGDHTVLTPEFRQDFDPVKTQGRKLVVQYPDDGLWRRVPSGPGPDILIEVFDGQSWVPESVYRARRHAEGNEAVDDPPPGDLSRVQHEHEQRQLELMLLDLQRQVGEISRIFTQPACNFSTWGCR